MIRRILYFLFAIYDRVTGFDKAREQYFQRHILRHMQRGVEAGLSPQEVKALADRALQEADYEVIFPGMLLRDMIDERIQEGKS